MGWRVYESLSFWIRQSGSHIWAANVAKYSSADKEKIVIHGTVRGIVSGTAILKYVTGETPKEVNSAIVKGKFNFSGTLNEPQPYI